MARRWLLAFGLVLLGCGNVEAQLWTHDIFTPGDHPSWPGKMTLAPDGNLVAVGAVDTIIDAGVPYRFGADMMIAKLDPASGTEIWRATYEGYDGGDDYLRGVGIDASGDIFAGGFTDNGNQGDYTVIKVSGADGAEIWRTIIDGTAHGADQVDDVAVDANGDVIAVGATVNYRYDTPTLTVTKLRGSDGFTLWRHDFPGFANSWVITGATVRLDVAGNAVVGFGSDDAANDPPAAFSLVKLASNDGATVWRYDHPVGTAAEVREVAMNASGDVVATGIGAGPSYALIVARINGTDGSELWLHDLYGSGEPFEGVGYAVAIDSLGDVVVAGHRSVDFSNLRFLVAKFNGATGAPVWQQAIQGDYGPMSIAFDLAIDANDDVISVGEIDNSTIYGRPDLSAVKFAGADGSVLWRQQFDGNPGGGGRLMWVTLDAAGDAYAIGDRYNELPRGVVVAKFDNEIGGSVKLPGDLLRMRDASDPSLKSLTIASRSGAVSSMPTSSSDPRDTGATLKISNPESGESTTIRLPAGGWAPSGGPTAAKGFVYRDASKGNGPCNIVRVRKGRSLKIACKGAGIDFSLDEAKQHTLQVELITGPLRQCMRFGGVVADEPGSFRARKAYRPESCD